jgi:hypothetical protein
MKELSAHFLGFFLMGLETTSLEGSCEEGFLGCFFPPGAATLLFSLKLQLSAYQHQLCKRKHPDSL